MEPYLTLYKKINSKWITDLLNVRTKTIKTLQRKPRRDLHAQGLGNDFLGKTPKAQAMKEKIHKLNHIKT